MIKLFGILAMAAVMASGSACLRAAETATPAQARKNFEAADTELNKVYKETLAGLDPSKAAALREAEREWIATRDGQMAAKFKNEQGAGAHSADYWESMAAYSRARAAFLRAYPGKHASPAPSPTPAASATPEPEEKPAVDQARKTFETTDNLLTIAYKEASAGLDAAKMSELRQKERDWINYREMLAKSAPYFNNGSQTDAPKGTVDYWQTMTDITRERIDFLRGYSGKNLPAGLTGVYSDSCGGTLELEERKSGVAFSISTVRGMARNKGKIEGVAQRNGEKAFFRDHPDPDDDRAPCEITFTFIEGHIAKVEEKNGDFYHGFNANFDGLYYKIGKLEKPLNPEQ